MHFALQGLGWSKTSQRQIVVFMKAALVPWPWTLSAELWWSCPWIALGTRRWLRVLVDCMPGLWRTTRGNRPKHAWTRAWRGGILPIRKQAFWNERGSPWEKPSYQQCLVKVWCLKTTQVHFLPKLRRRWSSRRKGAWNEPLMRLRMAVCLMKMEKLSKLSQSYKARSANVNKMMQNASMPWRFETNFAKQFPSIRLGTGRALGLEKLGRPVSCLRMSFVHLFWSLYLDGKCPHWIKVLKFLHSVLVSRGVGVLFPSGPSRGICFHPVQRNHIRQGLPLGNCCWGHHPLQECASWCRWPATGVPNCSLSSPTRWTCGHSLLQGLSRKASRICQDPGLGCGERRLAQIEGFFLGQKKNLFAYLLREIQRVASWRPKLWRLFRKRNSSVSWQTNAYQRRKASLSKVFKG